MSVLGIHVTVPGCIFVYHLLQLFTETKSNQSILWKFDRQFGGGVGMGNRFGLLVSFGGGGRVDLGQYPILTHGNFEPK